MGSAADDDIDNPSTNGAFSDVLAARADRRAVMAGGLATAAAVLFGRALVGVAGATPQAPGGAAVASGAPAFHGAEATLNGFAPVAMNALDRVTVPVGYTATVLARWGDPVNGKAPAFGGDVSETAEDQARQFGMHTDGMHFYPFDDATANIEGLLVTNHEYTDDGLLHPGGMVPWTAAKVAKSQAAHGVTVAHIRREGDGGWVVADSIYSRRITAATPMRFTGPAAGHPLLRTATDPTGTTVLGTVNDCSSGATPWGTYLTCEENFNGYFTVAAPDALQFRYGLAEDGAGYRWHEFDTRFDTDATPNEPNRFGWVVEINPWDSASVPLKRTALGRIKHEGASCVEAADGRVVVYQGDDQVFEYIYKFVSDEPWRDVLAAGRSPLDSGTLYVARFADDGTGTWLPLVWGTGPLTPANGFADPGAVLVNTRGAGDAVGATKMDRPEWLVQDPLTQAMFCSLTNNTQRGTDAKAGTDAANPRSKNSYGQIVRWAEGGLDAAATTFSWDLFVIAGDATLGADKAGTMGGDAFGSPDGLWADGLGRLWIQSDVSVSSLGTGDYANLGHNQMLAADIATGRIDRFLVGPNGCEVTGITATPDRRNLFVGIQHPGEPPSERSDPAAPAAVSDWPDGGARRPRSSVVVITKDDGDVIGT